MSVRLPTPPEVEKARANIAGVARRTPLWRLDAPTPPGTTIWLKLENLQPLGSFKLRAGINALKCADPAQLRAGVIAPSAGNFGLGLAFAARQMDLPVTIVAPDTAAMAKTDALRTLGAAVVRIPFEAWWQVLTTRHFDGASGVFFHPVAMNEVIAGNATIAAEIIEDLDRFDAMVVPFGGGGLISGIGSVMRRLKPGVRMIAAEAETAGPAAAALAADRPKQVSHTPSFVDGIGSSTVLAEMWPLVRETVDAAAGASLDDIAASIRLLATKHHVIAEGAGATSVAVALAGRAGTGDIVCIVTGGNIDASKLGPILAGQTP
jgi:threonine dehydratase